jgi:hypothetical protein
VFAAASAVFQAEAAAGAGNTDIRVPTTFEEAMASPQAEQWRQAMDEEMESQMEHGTWQLEYPPPGQKVIGVKWVFDLKRLPNGGIDRFKARLVAKGCSQREGVDFTEVFAPTGKAASLRALLAGVAAKGYVMHQVDVRTAFLNGKLEEVVYTQQPPGYHNGNPRVACRLEKALYGLRQGARAWHEALREELENLGYRAAESDPSLFVSANDQVWILVHVDDMFIAAPDHRAAGVVKSKIATKFDIKDLGEARVYLGMEITRSGGIIKLSQQAYTQELLERFGMADAAPKATPLSPGFRFQNPGESDREQLADGSEFRSVIGALMYLATNTRPDIAQAVGVLARHMAKPTEEHWAAAKGVLRYLVGTKEMGLYFGGESAPKFEAYSDADWAGDLGSRRSTTGYVFKLNGAAVSWSSKLQATVAASSTEAEYQASASACREGLWLRKLAGDLGMGLETMQVMGDNQAALSLIRNPIVSGRSKHIDVLHHFVREREARGEVRFSYCPTNSNVADVFTKALSEGKFAQFRAELGVR